MKKIWLLIFLLIPFTKVYADSTYYSGYRPYDIGSKEYREVNDIMKRTEYKIYNTQVTRYVDQGYVLESACENKFDNDTKRVYEPKVRTSESNRWYQSITLPGGLINSLNITVGNTVDLKEIYVYEKDKLLDTTIVSYDFDPNGLNDNRDSTYVHVVGGNSFSINFKAISSQKIRIVFSTKSGKLTGTIKFNFSDSSIEQRTFYTDELDVVTNEEYEHIRSVVGNMSNGTVNSYERIYTDLYHCYKITKVTTNIYQRETHAENEELILDDYVNIYNYFIRDKAIISDDEITTENFDLRTLVIEAPANDFIIDDSKVDYSKNGSYPVMFKFTDKFEVEKIIKINIDRTIKKEEPTTTSTTTTTKTTTQSTKKSNESINMITTTSTSTKKSNPIVVINNSSTTTTKEPTTKSAIKKTTTNYTCSTYNRYDEEEILEVEPLKGIIDEEPVSEKKPTFLYTLCICFILLLILIYLLYKKIEKNN